MFKNYLKIAFRQLLRNKTFSVINILGLAIGMSAFMLLALWVHNELSYDRYHSKKERIYELWNKSIWSGKLECWNVTPVVAAPTLRQHFPEIEAVTHVDWPNERFLSVGDKKLSARGNMVDPEFLSMFDFPLISGNINTVFKDPHSILLTPELAEKIFGHEDPVGKVIRIDNEYGVTVTGLINTPPNNTRFQFEYLMPWSLHEELNGQDNNWGNNSTHTYVLLKEHASIDNLQVKVKDLRRNYARDSDPYDMFLYPMERWRLYSSFKDGVESGGKIELVTLFGIVAGFILLIACINFMNLSTARSEKRAKEVGIRKTVGAMRSSLVKQFLGETTLLAFISFVLAIIIVQISMPAYNELCMKRLFVPYSSPVFWVLCIAFILLTGLLAGFYPAFYLSSFNPVGVLKGTFRKVGALVTPRKVLVVLQFVFAIVLITSTIIVRQQIRYVSERQVGYNKDRLVYHFLSKDLDKNYHALRQEIIAADLATSVTKTSSPLTEGWSDSWGFVWEGKDPNDKTDFDRFCADEHIVKTAGLQLLSGRDFDLQQFPTDSDAIIINESAAKAMGFKDPVGKIVKDGDVPLHVIGVIRDFILNSPYHPTKPIIIEGARGWFNVVNIRLNPQVSNLAPLEAIFKKYNPEFPCNLYYVDEQYARKFDDMNRMATLATLFASLTIFISCLGLFGLSAYMAENRIKEIGVRRVLGASVMNITSMLSVGFLRLVFIAFIVAAPLAWWLTGSWLKDFPYHIALRWWFFALAGILATLIALFTVSFQALKAARSNPVKSLRTE
ncbi:MAG: ABC transporter permease [Bacteroidetes bacterium]|nr:ABC transporter permease [Bacteroidota bacterium]